MEVNTIVIKTDGNLRLLEEFPHITCSGRWIFTKDTDWANGFWVGLLWLCYVLTDDRKYIEIAYRWLNRIEKRKKEKTFDLGFLFYPSFVLGFQITGDRNLKGIALEAAKTMSGLFHKKAGFIYNEIKDGKQKKARTIIDVMMNLPLLWWAYEETGDTRYYDIAHQHSFNTIKEFIRDDYSTIHVIDFDLETGEIIRKVTAQDYSDDSCWSRGQAWAIYGFSLAYQSSGEKKFIELAGGLADYFISNLPADYVPYWDFNDPEIPNSVKDSSAAAIACSGLLTLSELNHKQRFKQAAIDMLNSLSTNYLAEDSEGILKHGCYHKSANLGVDESLIWGDYYFVEALTKAQ